jgi:AcrR family transcriptional regulator
MPKGIPLSEEDRDRVRKRIFRDASKLFLQQGFHESSMRQIAEEAGMGKSTIYDYFSSKEEILLFFVEEEMDSVHVEAARIAEKNIQASEKLSKILNSLWEYLKQHQAMAALFTREVSRLSENATRRVRMRRLKYRSILQDVIQQGIEEGEFRDLDAELLASTLHSMITMPYYDWLQRDRLVSDRKIVDVIMDLFFDGVRFR